MPDEKNSIKENVLSKRLIKILDARYENDQDMIEALSQLSCYYKENNLQARRNLRSQIEKRSLDINAEFLSSFYEVKEAFDAVYSDINEMSKSIKDMTIRLQNSEMQRKQLLQQTSGLQSERDQNLMKEAIVTALVKKFQISADELALLQGENGNVFLTYEIFTILDKIENIHDECKTLMESGLQNLGLGLMEQIKMYQEKALERLYRWTQHHCRNIDNPDFTDLITHSMARLEDRPILFKYVIEEYTLARKNKLAEDFVNALTRGGTPGNPAPIEMRAHDAQIYITDMLSWVNKALLAEKQNLCTLFKLCKNAGNATFMADILGNVSEGICQPLKFRIEKILCVPTQVSVLYSLLNLLRYYRKCICKVLNSGLLDEVLRELQENSEKTFLNALQSHVNNKLIRVEAPPRDLSPTPGITSLLALLKDMLSTANMSEGRESDMGKITQSVMEPLLRAVNEQTSRLPPTDMAVYLLNCMYEMYTCLSLFEFMEDRLERLEAQSDAQIDTLTSEQASFIVANLNLGPIYTILQEQNLKPLSEIPGMEPSNLRNFLDKLTHLSQYPDSILLPQISLLSSSKHKKEVQKRSFSVLIVIYKQLHKAVHDPKNNYENPNLILDKTPEELEKLLCLSGKG